MKPRPPLPPGPHLVVGLARSGVAAALALRARGEEVIGCDAGDPDVGRLREAGVEVHVQTQGSELAARARTLVKSPGVPREAAVVTAARERGATVIGELELAWRLIPNEFIAVTGTNGKTTTTELIGHIHREAELADRAGELWWADEPLLRTEEIRLRGPHNLENAMAAAAATLARGVDAEAVTTALRSFAGVPHRLEEIVERDGVLYVDDSKATNPASARVALESFAPGAVHLIAGGKAKGGFGDLV